MASAQNDLILRGGTVVDGTGAPPFEADVRVRAGRIVEVGPSLTPEGEGQLDASGCVVAPGFLDMHTHFDAQLFWDPACDPNSQHGVTTALVGNCSLSLFPVNDAQRGPIADMFSYVEDIPLDALTNNVPWTWSDYAGYRDAVDARGAGVNVAALMGHSPLRLVVMGDEAWERAATADERVRMAQILDDAMAAGAWGLSTSFFDKDRTGRPVPSRFADDDEFDALLDVIAAHGHGVVEFVPDLTGETPEVGMDRLALRCGPRGIPLTWTGFVVTESNPASAGRWMDLAARYREQGIEFWPQLSPRPVDFRLNWDSSMMFMQMTDGWNRVVEARGTEAKRSLLSDPAWRDAARAEWDRTERAMFPTRRIEGVRIVEVTNPADQRWLARSLADLVAERGGHPSDVLADFALDNECRPGIVSVAVANSNVDAVAGVLADDRVLVTSSDAGAHVQMLCASGDTTLLLTRHVRERGDFTLEEAVHQVTGHLADVFGVKDRGVIEPGRAGDFAVFALDELHWDEDVFVADLPGGALRLRRPEGGYRATIVNGIAVQREGKLTGALPGRVLNANG
jgi:N-acyl-D-amino-acid deacylase